VISQGSWVAGKNSFFGLFFFVLAGLSLAAAAIFGLAGFWRMFPLYHELEAKRSAEL
jgi:hypothetical protein